MKTPEQLFENLEAYPDSPETMAVIALVGIWKELARANRIHEFELGVEDTETEAT